MPPPASAEQASVTSLLAEAQSGDRSAWSLVYQHTYGRLRRMAGGMMIRERRGHLLSPTALVTESFLKLHRILSPILSREHFFSLSARTMKQVLIDHGRRNSVFDYTDPDSLLTLLRTACQPEVDPDLAISVQEVFGRLRKFDPTAAEEIQLRYIDGRTVEEVARMVGRNSWDVRRDCDFGLRWMADQLGCS